MSGLPKKLLRSLPTLTEVVAMPEVPAPASVAEPRSHHMPDIEEIVERVMQRLAHSLQDHVREVVETLVQEQIRAMEPRLIQEVDVAMRQAVAQAVASELKEQRSGAA